MQEIRGISLVFREMWDTTVPDVRLCRLSSREPVAFRSFRVLQIQQLNFNPPDKAVILSEADLSRRAVEGLRFRGPYLEMFSTERSVVEIYGSLRSATCRSFQAELAQPLHFDSRFGELNELPANASTMLSLPFVSTY